MLYCLCVVNVVSVQIYFRFAVPCANVKGACHACSTVPSPQDCLTTDGIAAG